MNDYSDKIVQLVGFIDRFDTFGNLKRDMSLFSIAIGTLRKDKSIAQDIIKIASPESDGFGAVALSRILVEDYLHLLYLNDNPDDLETNIDKFNTHPNIEHYSNLESMKKWGFQLDETQETKDTLQKVRDGFDENKDKFLRRKESDTGFNPDDFYRTWTCISLDKLISETRLTETDEGKRSLGHMTEMYNLGSNVIHHNSFLIWFLACQDKHIIADEYPHMALNATFITLNKLIDLVIEISQTIKKDEEQQARLLNELADIMDGKVPK